MKMRGFCHRNISIPKRATATTEQNSVLKSLGKEDLAALAALAGLTVVLFMVVEMIGQLFDYVRSVFALY